MNDIHEVEVVIAPDGSVDIKVKGVKGQGCLEITREMIELLGQDVESRELTDEYHAQEKDEEHEWQQETR